MQVQIHDFSKGEDSEVKRCPKDGQSVQHAAGVLGLLEGLGSFWGFNAKIYIHSPTF